jgi:hypothetical protein
MFKKIEAALRRRFEKLHGTGENNQWDVYRCMSCGRLITWNRIRSGRICCSGRVVPTNPRLLETIRLFVLPWTF